MESNLSFDNEKQYIKNHLPILLISTISTDLVALCTNITDEENFEGMIVSSNIKNKYQVGDYDKYWKFEAFRILDSNTTVNLKN